MWDLKHGIQWIDAYLTQPGGLRSQQAPRRAQQLQQPPSVWCTGRARSYEEACRTLQMWQEKLQRPGDRTLHGLGESLRGGRVPMHLPLHTTTTKTW